ncbi:hypothetical protein GCM10010327_70470 [Streptomyces nitrosporeus]|nr:hypothetical protein GCM10010327_70470 [Streptomyces nitrosporeus]
MPEAGHGAARTLPDRCSAPAAPRHLLPTGAEELLDSGSGSVRASSSTYGEGGAAGDVATGDAVRAAGWCRGAVLSVGVTATHPVRRAANTTVNTITGRMRPPCRRTPIPARSALHPTGTGDAVTRR